MFKTMVDRSDGASEFFVALITEAPFINGDHGITPAKLDLPNSDLNDPKLITEGKDFVKRNFYSVMLAHLISLMWGFTVKPTREVLLRTSKSHDKEAALKRYLSTVFHIKLWYESDIIQRTARGSQDIYSVRKTHSAAAKNYTKTQPLEMPQLTPEQAKILRAVHAEMMHQTGNSDVKSILTEDPGTPISQFDMVVTQFCFVGFILLQPQTFGIQEDDHTKGLAGFLHLWAIFGRQLGIEDRFNLGIHYKNCGGDLKDFRRIYRDIFLPSLKNADGTAFVMWDTLIHGCSQYVRQLRLLPMIKFMVVDSTGSVDKGCLGEVMGWKDYLLYKFLVFATRILGRWKITNICRNAVIRHCFFRAQKKYLPAWNKK